MSAVRTGLFASALAILAACSAEAPPAPLGVGPASSPKSSGSSSAPKVELAAPAVSVPAAAPAPPPAPAAAVAPAAVIGPDIADLGPFDVLAWDEARARAVQRITPANLDQELAAVRAEIEGRP